MAIFSILREKRDALNQHYVQCTKLDVALNGMLQRSKNLARKIFKIVGVQKFSHILTPLILHVPGQDCLQSSLGLGRAIFWEENQNTQKGQGQQTWKNQGQG